MGRYGRPKMGARNNTIQVQNLNEKSMVKFLRECIAYLQGPLIKGIKGDTELINLRDEMLGHLNQTMFLFTLH